MYADDGSPVARVREEGEAPLLTTLEGVEYAAGEKPLKLHHGRAVFKLKISQVRTRHAAYGMRHAEYGGAVLGLDLDHCYHNYYSYS